MKRSGLDRGTYTNTSTTDPWPVGEDPFEYLRRLDQEFMEQELDAVIDADLLPLVRAIQYPHRYLLLFHDEEERDYFAVMSCLRLTRHQMARAWPLVRVSAAVEPGKIYILERQAFDFVMLAPLMPVWSDAERPLLLHGRYLA